METPTDADMPRKPLTLVADAILGLAPTTRTAAPGEAVAYTLTVRNPTEQTVKKLGELLKRDHHLPELPSVVLNTPSAADAAAKNAPGAPDIRAWLAYAVVSTDDRGTVV